MLAMDQLAVAVTSVVEPSGFFAVAVNCWVAPAANVAGFGEIVMAVTFRVALPMMLFKVAVTVVEPAATPLATPVAGLIVATAVFALFQVAVAVTSFVELSL
jgi:hypothetical protein